MGKNSFLKDQLNHFQQLLHTSEALHALLRQREDEKTDAIAEVLQHCSAIYENLHHNHGRIESFSNWDSEAIAICKEIAAVASRLLEINDAVVAEARGYQNTIVENLRQLGLSRRVASGYQGILSRQIPQLDESV